VRSSSSGPPSLSSSSAGREVSTAQGLAVEDRAGRANAPPILSRVVHRRARVAGTCGRFRASPGILERLRGVLAGAFACSLQDRRRRYPAGAGTRRAQVPGGAVCRRSGGRRYPGGAYPAALPGGTTRRAQVSAGSVPGRRLPVRVSVHYLRASLLPVPVLLPVPYPCGACPSILERKRRILAGTRRHYPGAGTRRRTRSLPAGRYPGGYPAATRSVPAGGASTRAELLPGRAGTRWTRSRAFYPSTGYPFACRIPGRRLPGP
jgi:hypothetical protein